MADDRWSDERLDRMRREGDPLADATVRAVFGQGAVAAVNQLLTTLVRNDDIPAGPWPHELAEYLRASERLPSWADAALHDLQYAGLPQEVEALILSVAEVFLPPPSPTPELPAHVPPAVQRAWAQATHALDEARTLAQQACARLQQSFPAWDVGAEACADSPAWAVIKKAETWQPDLIVVGSHGRPALGRLVLGSVSQKVLTEQLRQLIGDGLVRRQPQGAIPAPVEYSLTDYGRSLLPLVEEMRRWGRAHLERLAAQADLPINAK